MTGAELCTGRLRLFLQLQAAYYVAAVLTQVSLSSCPALGRNGADSLGQYYYPEAFG